MRESNYFDSTGLVSSTIDGELLVDGVGRRRRWDLLDLLEHDDMGVLIGLIRGAALGDAVGDDREDPEHAQAGDADAAAQDEGDGAALPESEVHEREVEACDEASTVVGMEARAWCGPRWWPPW